MTRLISSGMRRSWLLKPASTWTRVNCPGGGQRTRQRGIHVSENDDRGKLQPADFPGQRAEHFPDLFGMELSLDIEIDVGFADVDSSKNPRHFIVVMLSGVDEGDVVFGVVARFDEEARP